jgi:hypothetical protein
MVGAIDVTEWRALQESHASLLTGFEKVAPRGRPADSGKNRRKLGASIHHLAFDSEHLVLAQPKQQGSPVAHPAAADRREHLLAECIEGFRW